MRPAVIREMVLLRVRCDAGNRTAVLKEAEIFQAPRGRFLHRRLRASKPPAIPEKLDEFVDVMRSYGEIEVTRSGGVAMSLETKKLRLQPPVPCAAGAQA